MHSGVLFKYECMITLFYIFTRFISFQKLPGLHLAADLAARAATRLIDRESYGQERAIERRASIAGVTDQEDREGLCREVVERVTRGHSRSLSKHRLKI